MTLNTKHNTKNIIGFNQEICFVTDAGIRDNTCMQAEKKHTNIHIYTHTHTHIHNTNPHGDL